MKKISEALKSKVISDPNSTFNVLVVVKQHTDIKNLKLKGYNLLMDTILSTTLSGSEIKELSQRDEVQSIELNEEAGIL